eukprot:1124033-Pleurochrysis_carterae.AAC.2
MTVVACDLSGVVPTMATSARKAPACCERRSGGLGDPWFAWLGLTSKTRSPSSLLMLVYTQIDVCSAFAAATSWS